MTAKTATATAAAATAMRRMCHHNSSTVGMVVGKVVGMAMVLVLKRPEGTSTALL